MLIVKVFVNEKQIDELRIGNISNLVENSEYVITKPLTSGIVKHKRSHGWKPLVVKVLKKLIEEEKWVKYKN